MHIPLLLPMLFFAAPAFEWEPMTKPGGVEVRCILDATTVRLSGELHLTLTVEGPTPLEVIVPPLSSLLSEESAENWQVREGKTTVLPLDDKHERWQRTYRLSPFAVGDSIALRPAPIQVRAAAMEMTFSWNKPASIRVTTEVTQPGLEDLRPPTGIELLPPAPIPPGRNWLPMWIAGGVVLLIVGMVLIRRRRKVVLPVHDAAWAAAVLQELANGSPEWDRLAEVLRQFLFDRFGIPAERLTTDELADQLEEDAHLSPESIDQLRNILHICDIHKFAHSGDSDAEMAEWNEQIGEALAFLRSA